MTDSTKYKNWESSLDSVLKDGLSDVEVQSVDMFGPNVGFLKIKADVKVNGTNVPGICFLRGGSVSILVVINDSKTGEKYTIMTRQARVPVGKHNFPEIPAGMIDGSGDFKGVAAKEIEEELGMKIRKEDLVDLTSHYQNGLGYPGVYPSCGGSDEFIVMYLYECTKTSEEIEAMKGKCTGNLAEGEMIKLEIVRLSELHRHTPDMKALTSLFLYNTL